MQTFLFQIVVMSCISVKYLWKYGFAKYPDNLYAPCIIMAVNMDRLMNFRPLDGFEKTLNEHQVTGCYLTVIVLLISCHQ
jgi:hypothetical protein